MHACMWHVGICIWIENVFSSSNNTDLQQQNLVELNQDSGKTLVILTNSFDQHLEPSQPKSNN